MSGQKKVWNPLKKEYWTKENLFNQEKLEEAKHAFREEKEDQRPGSEKVADKLEKIGKKMQRTGCALTLLITFPIVGFIIFGLLGFFIGIILGGLIFLAMFKKK